MWVDRLDRRKVLVWTQALAMVQSLALAALTFSGHITIHWILALSVMQGIINAFDMPGRQSFMVQMVGDRADLGNAIAINSSMVNVARLIGPSLAGIGDRRHQRRLVLPHRWHQLHCGHRLAADDARGCSRRHGARPPLCSLS